MEQHVLCVQSSDFGLQFFACECSFIEDRFFATANQTWVSIHTSNEMMVVAWDSISWIWPETCWWWTWVNFCGALETNNSCNKNKFFIQKMYKKCQLIKTSRKTHLLDCKCATTDQANCNHESVHRMPNHRHNDFDSVHRERISNKLSNILGYLDRYQKHIHILALKLGLL